MNNLPGAFKVILNILFYVIYWAISLIMTWFILTNILNINITDYEKMWYVVLVFILIITFIFRKFFYISFKK